MIKNSQTNYGLISKLLHWVCAISILGMLASGIWMVELDYDHFWYYPAPHYHESIGILLFVLFVFRALWQLVNTTPHSANRAAHFAHILIYLMVFVILISGYLIPTANLQGIDVFNWLTVPALTTLSAQQTDIAGKVHQWFAWGLLALVILHIAAALKHHFINKDNTLRKMTINRRES